jgi:MFS transporter, SP family, sugar:H+ symporter
MESFLRKFFPEVLSGKRNGNRNAYCRYDDQLLTAFTSSLFIAAALSSLVAGRVTRSVGRQAVMLIGGAFFLAGSAVNAGGINVAMLIIGRMLLGFGVGFTAQARQILELFCYWPSLQISSHFFLKKKITMQAAPLYLAETAPARWRGAFTMAYSIFIVLGTLVAAVINYFTNRVPGWGWRMSLGLAAVPAAIVVLGALFVPDTPSSMVLRGDPDRARASLQRIRGPGVDVEPEFRGIVHAVDEARRHDEGAYTRLRGRGYRHYLVMALAIPTFFDLTGVIAIAVFSPVLFRTIGFSSQHAVSGSVILGLVKLAATSISSFVVDRAGRRFLFFAGGAAMIICQVNHMPFLSC